MCVCNKRCDGGREKKKRKTFILVFDWRRERERDEKKRKKWVM